MEYMGLAGIVFQTIIILLGGYGLVLRNDWSNKNLETRMVAMQEELKKLAQVIIQQAVQTKEIENLHSQLTMLQRTVEDLRRGNGFVRGRGGVNGEYDK
jgi:hypothetical protein